MLAFAAYTPHPLVTIPELGKASIDKARKTITSFKTLTEELYSAKPDKVIILSSHTPAVDGAFTINQRPKLIVEFSKFGNLSDKLVFLNDVGFGYKIKEAVETSIPVALVDDEVLDYGTAVPLYHLSQPLDKETLRILSIGASNLDLASHHNFGTQINRQINLTTDRIAVIASGDLSHGVTQGSVVTYDQKAAAFNKSIVRAIKDRDVEWLLSVTEEDRQLVTECGLNVLSLLFGILDQRKYEPDILSYESSLGVGYLAVYFALH